MDPSFTGAVCALSSDTSAAQASLALESVLQGEVFFQLAGEIFLT